MLVHGMSFGTAKDEGIDGLQKTVLKAIDMYVIRCVIRCKSTGYCIGTYTSKLDFVLKYVGNEREPRSHRSEGQPIPDTGLVSSSSIVETFTADL